MILGLIMGSFFACSGDKGDTAEETVTTCLTTIKESIPANAEVDFYINGSITFELQVEDDATAVITLTDANGSVAGTSSVDGSMVTFTPDAALTSSTAYTASLTYCGHADPVDITFTTSSLGAPLTGSVAGNTYAVDIASGTFVQPAGIGSLIGDALQNNILLGIISDDNDSLQVRGAISEDGSTAQDMCTETLEDFPPADFSASPYFEIPEGDITLSIAGVTATIYGLNVSGMFAADGSYFGGGELRGDLDARDLVSVVGELGLDVETAEDICNLVVGFGVPCTECNDGELYCIAVEVVDLVADATGTELLPLTAQDILDAQDAGTCEAAPAE